MKKYIAFDVGGTKVKHGLLLEDGTIISKDRYNTQCDDLQKFLSDMINVIQSYTSNNEISGIAVSLPGFINTKTGFSESAGSVLALQNQNLKNLLEERIHLPVAIENDGNCAALAEKMNGNATNCKDFICFTIGTGIGGGIYINEQILHGHSFKGGEFGFMITRGGHQKKDIMHYNASTSALIREYKKYKQIPVQESIEGEEVFTEAKNDGEIQSIIKEWIQSISYGILNLAVTLNPEKILIGGGVSVREELIEQIENHLEQISWWSLFKVPIDTCKHKNDAGMIGALYHLKQYINANN